MTSRTIILGDSQIFPNFSQTPLTGVAFVYDPQFVGPEQNRSSTDTPFTIIFTIFILTWMAMGTWGMITHFGFALQTIFWY